LGFIGLGFWGTRLARASLRTGGATVVGGFARSPEARAEFAGEFGGQSFDSVRDLLDADLDAVVIATPIAVHAPLVIEAALAGKHIFVEKPFTPDVASAHMAMRATDEAGVVLQVGHQRRLLAATRRVGEWARSGDLGIVHSMEATIFNSDGLHPNDSWKFHPDQRQLAAMTQQGVHMIDNMQFVAGPARRVSAFTQRVLPAGQAADVTAFLIEYESGPIGVISNSAIGTWVATFAVHGTSGSAWSEDDGTRLFRQAIDDRARSELVVEPVDAVTAQMVEFLRCIREGGRPEVDGYVATEVVAVTQAGILSVERGAAVEVDEVRQ
jgi:UDP-N-acetyl-2-amino-2-deoxyglucuronate dehydrogenase